MHCGVCGLQEYQQRLGIFQSNVEKVRTHNAGKSSYKVSHS